MPDSLIQHGAYIIIRDNRGSTAIHLAAYSSNVSVLYKVSKAHTLVLNNLGWTPLMMAAIKGGKDATELLIQSGARIDILDKLGWTALRQTAYNYQISLLKTLLKAHAVANVLTVDTRTPLMLAAGEGNEDVADLLIQNGACIDVCDHMGCTAIHLAALNNEILIIKNILKTHTEVNILNDRGQTPIISQWGTHSCGRRTDTE